MVFLAVAVVTALLYALWTVWVPLLPDNLYLPLLDLGKITGYRWTSALLFLYLVLSLYALYAVGYRQVRQGRVGLPLIFGAGALFCAELLWESIANAHNDGMMMLFGLLAVWLFVARVDLLVLPAVALGTLVELPVALIAPILFIGLSRRNRARAVEGALLAVALVGVVYR